MKTELTRIFVTKGDIAKGCTGAAFNCPVARAFKRRGFTVGVTGWRISLYGKDGSFLYQVRLPDEVIAFIRNFDEKLPVSPFKFEIDLTKAME